MLFRSHKWVLFSVIETENMEVIAEVETGGGPAHVAVKPDGLQVWVANEKWKYG